jgi:hypothetical protein
MTLRSIQWINDAGLLVGLTMMGEFDAPPALGALSLSATIFTLTVPASGALLGATFGSAITAAGLPVGLTINAAPGWAYDGTGAAGSTTIALTETLTGSPNSPQTTSISVSIAPPATGSTLDFSQPANSGLIAAARSF